MTVPPSNFYGTRHSMSGTNAPVIAGQNPRRVSEPPEAMAKRVGVHNPSVIFATECEKAFRALHNFLSSPIPNPSELSVEFAQDLLSCISVLRIAILHEWIEEDQEEFHFSKEEHPSPLDLCGFGYGNRNMSKQKDLSEHVEVQTFHDLPPPLCTVCSSCIFNRGFYVRLSTNFRAYCCAACFAQGAEVRDCTMYQRYSVKLMLNVYHHAVEAFNRFIAPAFASQLNPAVNVISEGRIIDDFLMKYVSPCVPVDFSDPRPAQGRTDITIGYHMMKRRLASSLGKIKIIYCHYCKCRRKFFQLAECTDKDHVGACTLNGPMGKGKNGPYYCFQCIHVCFKENALDVLSRRDWKCYSCHGNCDCGTCKNPASVNPDLQQQLVQKVPSPEIAVSKAVATKQAVPKPAISKTQTANPVAVQKPPAEKAQPVTRAKRQSERTEPIASKENNSRQSYELVLRKRRRIDLHDWPTSSSSDGETETEGQSNSSENELISSEDEVNRFEVAYKEECIRTAKLQKEIQELRKSEALKNKELQEMQKLQSIKNKEFQELQKKTADVTILVEENKILKEKLSKFVNLEQQATQMVPNLKKIAKAMATQAIQLANALEDNYDE